MTRLKSLSCSCMHVCEIWDESRGSVGPWSGRFRPSFFFFLGDDGSFPELALIRLLFFVCHGGAVSKLRLYVLPGQGSRQYFPAYFINHNAEASYPDINGSFSRHGEHPSCSARLLFDHGSDAKSTDKSCLDTNYTLHSRRRVKTRLSSCYPITAPMRIPWTV